MTIRSTAHTHTHTHTHTRAHEMHAWQAICEISVKCDLARKKEISMDSFGNTRVQACVRQMMTKPGDLSAQSSLEERRISRSVHDAASDSCAWRKLDYKLDLPFQVCYCTHCLVSRRNVRARRKPQRLKRELVLLGHTLTCLLIRIVVPAGWLLDVQSRFQGPAVLVLYLNHQAVIATVAMWISRGQPPESQTLPDVQR